MTERDRLIELIANADTYDSYECKLCTKEDTYCIRCGAEKLTDYLLANGVIVLPCKFGDYILWDNGLKDSKLKMLEVKGFCYNTADLGLRYILEDCQPIISHSGIVGVVSNYDIVKALECCYRSGSCSQCPYEKLRVKPEWDCSSKMIADAIDLINRQKAEIERLQTENEKQKVIMEEMTDLMFLLPFETDYDKAIKTAKAEAVKEFAERLKEKAYFHEEYGTMVLEDVDDITDNLVKEMVGGADDRE